MAFGFDSYGGGSNQYGGYRGFGGGIGPNPTGGGYRPEAYGQPFTGGGYAVPPAYSGFNPWGPGTSYAGPGNPTQLGGGNYAEGTLDPTLTSQFTNYLSQAMGRGATPFNLTTNLPWGGTTKPGQLNAPLNPLDQMLLQGYTTGDLSKIPGLNTLSDVAQHGISAVPTWQTMVDAAQRQIGEGAANVREQEAFGGNLAGTPFGTSIADYYSQSNKDLNSILANLQFQGIGEQLGAAQTVAGIGEQFGQNLQNLGQQDIQNLYNEFIRTRPEYSPLLQYEAGLSTTFPPIFGKQQSGGLLGGLLGGAGTFATGLADLLPVLGV